MATRRVYVDSGVLIAACRAQEPVIAQRAAAELDAEDVEFLYSPIVKLETLPLPTRNRYTEQVQWYKEFFEEAIEVPCDADAQQAAVDWACDGNGLGTGDALHVAAALSAGADELLTAESEDSQIMRTRAIKVRTIRY